MTALEGKVFSQYLLSQILLILVAGVLVLWWSGQMRVSEERRSLREVGESQAQLAGDLRLPLSGELAGHFGSLSGIEIGFLLPDGGFRTAKKWSEDELNLAWRTLENGQEGEVLSDADWMAVAFPIAAGDQGGAKLVALQRKPRVLAMGTRREIVWPVGIAVALALGSAFALARSRARLAAEQERRKAAEQMALLGKMATSMAHEVKNPAAAILMQARTLEGGAQAEVGQMIRDDAEEIVSLVNQWLFVARPEPPKMGEVDLGALLEELVKRVEAWARYHRCELKLQQEGDLRCWGDRTRLEQVFRNLIQNAVQAMPGGGTVTINLVGTGDGVSFSVADAGEGFSAKALQSFGEAFYSEREGGIGLGLALVKGVVEAHGGAVTARNLGESGASVEGTLSRREKAA
ncbi:sensor histidine kinase [Roseibacillus persicicus]|uniref:histidine kinase n=1 Tax=Roseibacillus persicicus TaxID=454148 RepID=A0A918WP86_9BACT|nr:HAMP domain-containing sensor histidine kinase [Roseibacillus persicicus]GHC64919.1 hypothetical protein GCM10007100_35850 [Roseibacillus persicicus]